MITQTSPQFIPTTEKSMAGTTNLADTSPSEFRHHMTGILDLQKGDSADRSFYNVFLFPRAVDRSNGVRHLEDTLAKFRDIDRKLAICYPTLESSITMQTIRHRLPLLSRNLKIVLTAGFRIHPDHGFYFLKDEIVYHESKKKFYTQPGEQKSEQEVTAFLKDLFDRLLK